MKPNRKVVIRCGSQRTVARLLTVVKDNSFFIIEEGPGAVCYVRWDAGRNSWTIGKRAVEVKGL